MNVKYFNNAQVQQNAISGRRGKQTTDVATDQQTKRRNSINWAKTSGIEGNQKALLETGALS